MKRRITGFVVVAALAVGAGLQRQALLRAKNENRNLQAIRNGDSLSPLVNEPWRGQAVPVPPDHATHDLIRDLPRLRNEVRELRAQKQELAQLQTENEALLHRLKERRDVGEASAPTEAAGFIMNSTWAYAGFGSPEAAVQSFFCALRDSNIVNLVACITPEAARNMGLIVEGRISQRPADQVHFWSMGKIKGYRIAEIQPRADDRVKVKVQAAINGESLEFSVRRSGQEWKLELDR